jgi:AcrR family transcriptional regulator
MLVAALDAFDDAGYQGTSIAHLAAATGLSKAAFPYHFGSKSALAQELAGPLLDALETVAAKHSDGPQRDDLLRDYLGVLVAHAAVARWMDGDKYLLNHDEIGRRLTDVNEAMHSLLVGPDPSPAERALGSAVLGMFWRPVRNGYLDDDPQVHAALIRAAMSLLAQHVGVE